MNRKVALLSFSVVLIAVLMCYHILTKRPKSPVGYMTSDVAGVSLYFDEYDMPIRGVDIEGDTFFSSILHRDGIN